MVLKKNLKRKRKKEKRKKKKKPLSYYDQINS